MLITLLNYYVRRNPSVNFHFGHSAGADAALLVQKSNNKGWLRFNGIALLIHLDIK